MNRPAESPSHVEPALLDGDGIRSEPQQPQQEERQPVSGASRAPLSVGFTISTIGHAIQRRFEDVLVPLGIVPQEFGLLQALASTEGVTQQALANQIKVAPSRMTVLIDGLEKRGMLARYHNPEDRRARALFLTPQGHQLLERGVDIAIEHEQLMTSDLNDDERALLTDLLGRVGKHVGIPIDVHPSMGHSALLDQ